MRERRIVAFLYAVLCAGALHADTIQSVPQGGVWSDTLAWVGAAIPGGDDDVVINGIVSIIDSAACRTLTVADSAVLQNGGDSAHVILAVAGHIVNNGTIRNDSTNNDSTSRELWLELFGDITNNGIWIPAKTFIASRDTQIISQSPTSGFCGALYKTDAAGRADTFPLVAASDLTVNADTFDCSGQGDSAALQGTLDMGGYTLRLNGHTAFTGANVSNIGYLEGSDSVTVSSCTFADKVHVLGIITVTDSMVCFNADMTVEGTLQSGGSLNSIIVKVKGLVWNIGNITSNRDTTGNELWLELYGNLYNAGKWDPARTYIALKKEQTMGQIAQSVYEGLFFTTAADSSTDTFPLVAASSLIINSERFDGNGIVGGNSHQGTINMSGYNLTLYGGTNLTGAVISHTNMVTCLDSSMVTNCTFEHPVALGGRFTVGDSRVYFNDTVTVQDTLQNDGSGRICMGLMVAYARNGIINRGVIRNHPKAYDLWLEISRNAANEGIWSNTKNVLVDSVDQIIMLADGKAANALFSFDAIWPSGPYAWQKDGQYTGDTARFLDLDSLTMHEMGAYRCRHDTAWSRTITVQWDTTIGVANPGKGIQGLPLAFRWDIVSGTKPSLCFQVPYACRYEVSVYDIRGRCIVHQQSGVAAGRHSILLLPARLAVGSYAVQFKADKFKQAKRVVIVR
ncbi:MAG: hypothetical protein JW768_08135 [Chitinispirillaceae bacterium]|nr:hypothetical protein [Chitinispirillaceae bacterium]